MDTIGANWPGNRDTVATPDSALSSPECHALQGMPPVHQLALDPQQQQQQQNGTSRPLSQHHHDDEQPGFAKFLELGRAFGPSRAFTTAVKLGLFSALYDLERQPGRRGVTAAELREALGLCQDPRFRAPQDLFDLLVSVGALQREGSGATAMYRNTRDAERYLATQSPDYIGGLPLVNHDRSYLQFTHLEHMLRHGHMPPPAAPAASQGVPGGAAVPGVQDLVEVFAGHNPAAAEGFALGMTGASRGAFKVFAQRFDFRSYSTLGDFGGSAGVLCCCVAAAHPHMRCTTLDLPALHPTAATYVAKQGMEGRVQVMDWDFFGPRPFPRFDVITMGMVLHDWGIDRKMALMRRAYEALPPGGALVAVEVLIDDDRRRNTTGLYMSLNMALEFDREWAFDYTFKEFKEWTEEVGFKRWDLMHLVGPTSAAIAYK